MSTSADVPASGLGRQALSHRSASSVRLLGVPLAAKVLGANGVITGAAAALAAWGTIWQEQAGVEVPHLPWILAITALGVAASLIVNALVIRAALAPLGELERVASAVVAGDHRARATLGPIYDPQTSRIALATNQMLDALAAQRLEIEAKALQLADLSARELMGREDERRSVAAELREEIGQSCAAITIGLRALANVLSRPIPDLTVAAAQAEGLLEMARAVHDAVHRRAQGLRPSAIDDLGAAAALRSAVARWSALHQVSVTFVAEGEPPLSSSPLGIVLYRVAEEAVANAIQHGRPTGVAVSLESRPTSVQLTVTNDGPGFDVAAALRRRTIGLVAMRERLALVGGSLEITSSSSGTAVRATVPLSTR